MKKFLSVMAFVVAFGASTRVFGIDGEIYEQKDDPVSAIEHYEAVYD